MRFKEFYLQEGRNAWNVFSIKKNESRWTFKNNDTGKLNFIAIKDPSNIGGMQKFLEDLGATPGERPKTFGTIDYKQFAVDVIEGKKSKVYVRSGKFETIKKTWMVED